MCVLATQSCPTLGNPKDCSPPGFSVHGILQARLLEWILPSPEDLLNPGIKPWSPVLQADTLPFEPQGSPHYATSPLPSFCDFSCFLILLHEPHFCMWTLWYHVKNQFALILHTVPKQQMQMQQSVMNKMQMIQMWWEGKDASTSQWGKYDSELFGI